MKAVGRALKAHLQLPKKPTPSPWLLRSVFEAYPLPVAILDHTGLILHTNEAWDVPDQNAFFGPRYNVGQNYFEICLTEHLETRSNAIVVTGAICRVIRGEQDNLLFKYQPADLSRPVFSMQVTRLKLPGPTTVMVSHQPQSLSEHLVLAREKPLASIDIGERQMEEGMSEVGGRLIQVQEEERRRIARELHDGISQKLALLSMELQKLSEAPASRAGEFRRRATELWQQVRQVSADVHQISYNLHPSKLENLGLVAAVRSLCHEVSGSSGVHVDFNGEGKFQELPGDVSLALFRVVQEGLRNVVRHAGSTMARVELWRGADSVNLRITDSGSGFEPESVKGKRGLGLISMRERLRLVCGEFVIRSEPSRGTQIDAKVPLNQHPFVNLMRVSPEYYCSTNLRRVPYETSANTVGR